MPEDAVVIALFRRDATLMLVVLIVKDGAIQIVQTVVEVLQEHLAVLQDVKTEIIQLACNKETLRPDAHIRALRVLGGDALICALVVADIGILTS